ncbi:uncharacterized protein LOC127709908 [Mytilus californianus]|uniref:uncharacterized protein LOC127709908 n=1 Tax=Mytilus californianus TaxID=6549 RepID=UPI0022465301|nr:uncharacterized protein LOC127709908 [Mytilus californianus]
MAENVEEILSKRIKPPKKQSLAHLRKKIISPGEFPYDLSERTRSKCAYSVNKATEETASPPGTTVLSEPSISQSIIMPPLMPENLTNNTNPVNLHVPDEDSTSTSCQLSESIPNEIVAPERDIQSEFFLNEDQLYLNMLCKGGTQTVSISDGLGLFMVLPDLDFTKAQLKRDCYVLLQRKAVYFQEAGAKWLCTCSCQPIWSKEIMSSSSWMCSSFEDFMTLYPPCLHRRVCSFIYEQYDNLHQCSPADYFADQFEETEHGYTASSVDAEEATRIESVPVVRIWSSSSKTHGLVTVLRRKYYCFCCKKNYCDHVKKFKHLSSNNIDDDNYPPVLQELTDIYNSENETLPNSTSTKIICHSYEKIPFGPTEALTRVFSPPPTRVFSSGIMQNVQRHDDTLVFIPSNTICKHCSGRLDSDDPIKNKWIAGSNVTVVTKAFLGNGIVYYRPCLDCDSVTLFDGQDHCFLNMGTYLVGYDILRSYMHGFLHGRRPLYTFYSVFVDDHYDYGNEKILELFSYHKLRSAWLSFLKLLDIDFENGFSCPDCPQDGPDIIICDGTSLSFQRRMWSWKNTEVPKKTSSKKKSGFRERVFIQEEKTRKLLHRYVTGGDIHRGKQTSVLTIQEKNELMRYLQSYPALYLFIKSIDNGTVKLSSKFSNFITSLASKSPVCGYIHPSEEVGKLIQSLVKGVDVKCDYVLWQSLHNHIPVLFKLLDNSSGNSAPADLRPLLHELWDLSLQPFDNCDIIDDSSYPVEAEEMSFFPALSTCRPRGHYGMDEKKSDNSCHKKYKGHPSLLPGVFTVYCPHGKLHFL